ncbi:hypothetical protein BDQ12DRAFT_578761, partial [Crucibulum laeve]
QIYVEHMLAAQFGYPLWNPMPSSSLPLAYQKEGLSIGDFGILTPDGSFDFIFNIWLPFGHSVN